MARYKIDHLAVVLFAYNEEGNLLRLLRRLHITLKFEAPGVTVQYAICVQGTDGTSKEVERFAREVGDESEVNMLHSEQPSGVRKACIKAFELVQGRPDAYLTMDCDLNHQPEELPLFLAEAAENRVVIGSRFCEGGRIIGMPRWKHVLSVAFNRLTALMFRIPIRDKTSGYRLICTQDLDLAAVASRTEGVGFDFYIEFLLCMRAERLEIVEVPICFLVRTHGVSKMRLVKTTMDYLKLMRRLKRVAAAADTSKDHAPE